MNQTPVLDDVERTIVRTLHTKAAQLEVDEASSFDPDAAAPIALHRTAPPRSRGHRRLLALVAAFAVVIGGLVALRGQRGAEDGDGAAVATEGLLWSPASDDQVTALLPRTVPDGWTLADIDVAVMSDEEVTWQLFAVDGPSPLSRGVLVGTWAQGDRVLGGEPTHTIHGQPAMLDPSTHPFVPPDGLELEWIEDGAMYRVVAAGFTEDGLLEFLDSLEPRADPVTGLDAPGSTPLPELDEVTTRSPLVTSSASYRGPGGVGDLRVTAESSVFGGGLLHRLVGEGTGSEPRLRGGDGDYRFVSQVRSDGWTVEASTQTPAALPGSGSLDEVLAGVEPATRAQLVELATAQPITTTATVDGWTVEVHGIDSASLALCLTPGGLGDRVCTLAQGGPPLTAASALVEGQWVVVALTGGSPPATIETTPSSFGEYPDGFDVVALHGEQAETGDQTVELVPVPDDIEAVAVTLPGEGGSASGYGFDRPTG